MEIGAVDGAELSSMEQNELLTIMAGERSTTSLAKTLPEKEQPKPLHKTVIALHVAGQKIVEIADALQLSTNYISTIINYPGYAWYIEEFSDKFAAETLLDARKIIQGHTAEAAMRLVHHMRHAESEAVSLKATESILDRGGVPKAEIQQQSSLLLQEDQFASLKAALEQLNEHVPTMAEVEDSHTALAAAKEQSGQPNVSGAGERAEDK